MKRSFAGQKTTKHSAGEYVRHEGDAVKFYALALVMHDDNSSLNQRDPIGDQMESFRGSGTFRAARN